MRSGRRVFMGLVAGAILLSVTSGPGAAPRPQPVAGDLERLIALPPSPGSIALLFDFHDDPRVPEYWLRALRMPDAATRAASARLLHVARVASALPALREAFGAETDAEPLREIGLAIAAMGAPEDLPPLLERAGREGRPLSQALAAAAARRGPDGLPLYFSAMTTLDLTVEERQWVIAIAARFGSHPVDPWLETALRQMDGVAWGALLSVARTAAAPVPVALLTSGIRDGSCAILAATAWHLALGLSARADSASPAILAAVDERLARDPCAGLDPDDRLVVELLRRFAGGPPREDTAWIQWAGAPTPDPAASRHLERRGALRAAMTPGEASALKALSDRLAPPEERMRSHAGDSPASYDLRPRPAAWLLSGLPKGLASGVLSMTGCPAKSGAWLNAARLSHPAPAFLPQVEWVDRPRLKSCRPAATALVALSLPPADHLEDPESAATLFLTLDEQFVARAETQWTVPGCGTWGNADPAPSAGYPRRVTFRVPEYPDKAKAALGRGWSAMSVLISGDGVPIGLRSLRGSDQFLASAIHAVLQWRYDMSDVPESARGFWMVVLVDFDIG